MNIYIYMYIYIYVYIYIYGQLLSFAGGRFIAPASENAKMSLTKSPRNSKQAFSKQLG